MVFLGSVLELAGRELHDNDPSSPFDATCARSSIKGVKQSRVMLLLSLLFARSVMRGSRCVLRRNLCESLHVTCAHDSRPSLLFDA